MRLRFGFGIWFVVDCGLVLLKRCLLGRIARNGCGFLICFHFLEARIKSKCVIATSVVNINSLIEFSPFHFFQIAHFNVINMVDWRRWRQRCNRWRRCRHHAICIDQHCIHANGCWGRRCHYCRRCDCWTVWILNMNVSIICQTTRAHRRCRISRITWWRQSTLRTCNANIMVNNRLIFVLNISFYYSSFQVGFWFFFGLKTDFIFCKNGMRILSKLQKIRLKWTTHMRALQGQYQGAYNNKNRILKYV